MKNQRILYQQDNGTVAIIIPSVTCGLTIEQIAAKDVPFGKVYKIVDVADLPTDRTTRNAWTVDTEDLADGTGADYGAGSTNSVIGWNEDKTPVLKEG